MEEFKIGDIVEIIDVTEEDAFYNDRKLLIGTIFEVPDYDGGRHVEFELCYCGCGCYFGDLRYLEDENEYGSFKEYCALFKERRYKKPGETINFASIIVKCYNPGISGKEAVKKFKVNSLCIPK